MTITTLLIIQILGAIIGAIQGKYLWKEDLAPHILAGLIGSPIGFYLATLT